MIRRPPRSTQSRSSAASDVYKRQVHGKMAEAKRHLSTLTDIFQLQSLNPDITKEEREAKLTALKKILEMYDNVDREEESFAQREPRFLMEEETKADRDGLPIRTLEDVNAQTLMELERGVGGGGGGNQDAKQTQLDRLSSEIQDLISSWTRDAYSNGRANAWGDVGRPKQQMGIKKFVKVRPPHKFWLDMLFIFIAVGLASVAFNLSVS
eukprot:TRINITY_DN7874_c0_g1_i2.p1 TRINITY_DN7874_c0_g1~~TRINITY_DN7874_c0_g1_i2.p1  ORF type:complete len:210 (+),score=61.45 TRINITY_DN7874_c0_g1_i2:11-640(+)